jgi:RND superfamily putative drug exporter
MHDPVVVQTNPQHTVAVVSIPLAGTGQDQTSNQALATLRGRVIPATVGRVAGVQVAVGSQTAFSHDFNDRMRQRVPLVFGFVLGLARYHSCGTRGGGREAHRSD